MKEKEQVGCLHDSHQFIIILVDFKLNSFHLVGARSETEARTLTKAIQLANRFQEMTLMAVDLATDLNRSYLNWMVQSCNSGVKFFEVKSDMISSEENFKILKHFLVKSELIEHLCFKKYDMSKHQINSITSLIVTLPQTQIKAFKFIKCNFTDDDLPDIGRAIKHNGYLEYLYFEGCDITDKSLRFFSGLWQYVPFLEYFGLTYSPKVKGEIYFSSFLEKMVSELKLKTLDLSHNSLTEKISTILAEEVFNVKNVSLERLDLSHNQFTPKENWMIYQKFQDSMIKEKCQLIMEGYPIDGHYFFLIDDKQKSLTVELERIGIHRNQTKRLLLTRREKTKAKEIREEINMSILNQKTIEKIFKLCKVIDKQPFEFPPQYVEEAVRFIRETMMNADELGDYYGFHYSLECSKILGMNQKGIRLKANAFQNRTDSFTQELTRLLNFQIPETQANIILDELVEKAIKRDYRGDAIDLLFYLKNIRDSQANILLLKKTDAAAIEMNLMQKDPFFILNYDKEFANICRDYAKHSDKASDHLGYHYQWINYSLITRLTKQQIKSIINMEQEKSDKNKSKLNTFRSERALFLLSDIGSDEFEAGQEDKLLLITRALCRYRYYSKPYKSSRSSIEDRVDSIYRQRDDDDISNIDSKVLDSDKHSIIDRFGNKSPITGAGSEVVSAKAKSDIGEGTDEVKKAKSSNASVIGGRKENIDDALVLRDVSIGESGSLVEDEKLPFSINRTEYKIGLKVNTLVIKICRLDFNRQQTSIVVSKKSLLILFLKIIFTLKFC